MSMKTELIALGIRLVADRTTLICKPDAFEIFISDLFGLETYDRRLARSIEAEVDRGVNAAKRMNVNRKFKKIIQHI